MPALAQKTREELLALIPSDAKRIKVTDEMGATKWRVITKDFSEIEAGDEIVVHNGEPLTMKSSPGRRKKAAVPAGVPAPVSVTAAQVQAAKQKFLKKDPLLLAITQSVDSEDVLHHAMLSLAEEAASLGFERSEEERKGKPTSQVSVRRIGAIKAVLDAWIKRRDQQANKVIDLASPAFDQLFGFMVETFREAMLKGGVPPDQATTIFTALASRLKDETWELEARNRMKGV